MLIPPRQAVPLLAAGLLALTACGEDGPDTSLPALPLNTTAAPAPSASTDGATTGLPGGPESLVPIPTGTASLTPGPAITVPSVTPSRVPLNSGPPTEAPEDPLSPRPPLETAPPTGQPGCDAADLSVTDADAIITERFVQEVFVVRTTGPDCQLRGYPEVSLLDAAGNPVPAAYDTTGFGLPLDPPQTQTLSAGTSLSFFLASGRFGDCVEAATVRVVLPGTSQALEAATSFRVCGGEAAVSPVARQGAIE